MLLKFDDFESKKVSLKRYLDEAADSGLINSFSGAKGLIPKDSKTIPFAPTNLNIELNYPGNSSTQEHILLVLNQITPRLMNERFTT